MNEIKRKSYNKIIDKYIAAKSSGSNLEPFASLPYAKELEIKNSAFKEYLASNQIKTLKLYNIVSSPKQRYYRTTTKRKVVFVKNEFKLFFNEKNSFSKNESVFSSILEPKEHYEIYKFIHGKINEKAFHFIAKVLNYIIIRGTYDEFCLIFNVAKLNAKIVNFFKRFSKEIIDSKLKISSSFLYLDPTKSNYYFESERPEVSISFKKLFGADKLFKVFKDIKYSLHPTSFSQINESMVPILLEKAKELLGSELKNRLIDLYSGYGLFSVFFKDLYNEIIGFESDSLAIKSANENNKYRKGIAKINFIKGKICYSLLEQYLPIHDSLNPEIVIMDPPRKGNNKNVIDYIASRSPLKVLHIFCGTDEIPEALDMWNANSYYPSKIIPMDLFPGTKSLETLILLQKK